MITKAFLRWSSTTFNTSDWVGAKEYDGWSSQVEKFSEIALSISLIHFITCDKYSFINVIGRKQIMNTYCCSPSAAHANKEIE